MYEAFYGFARKPFSLLPDADLVFPSKHHRRAIHLLDYGAVTQAGFMIVSGDVGAGKTTIIRHFLKKVGPDVVVGVVANPSPHGGLLLGWIASAFDLNGPCGDDAARYDAFVRFLLALYAQGKRAILIIDEAQNLSAETLEELRMLSNVNNERDLLLQIVLVGQPELVDKLKNPSLRQFVQRVAVHCHLGPLVPAETAAYIRYRLSQAGGSPDLFGDEACALIHYFTGGVPRLINLLCDQALVYGYAEDMRSITIETVAEVVMDRARYGLSAYREVRQDLSLAELRVEMREALLHIRQANENQKKAMS